MLCNPNAGDKYFELQQKFELNVSRFAAAKAYQVTQLIRRLRVDANGTLLPDADYRALARAALNTFNRYQAAEYNTAVARARTAKQWIDFKADAHRNELLPNIKWLPSRSAVKRELHISFYNKVWAKTDDFWLQNQPGNLWNCKCDWIETDEPVTGKPHNVTPARGLAGNPGKTGKIFSNDASYLTKKALKAIEDLVYADSQSKLGISAIAHHDEVGDNVRMGRVAVRNHGLVMGVNKHIYSTDGWKNPEYWINDSGRIILGDAKRIESWNVAKSFSKCIQQEAKVIFIDGYKMYKKFGVENLNVNKLARGIANRKLDFTEGRIERCYVVWGERSVEIPKRIFNSATRLEIIQNIEMLLTTLY